MNTRWAALSVLVVLAGTGRKLPAQATGVSSADSLSLITTIYDAAFRNGTQAADKFDSINVVCVAGLTENADPPASVLAALQEGRSIRVRPMSACRVEPNSVPPLNASKMIDVATGQRGIRIGATAPIFGGDGSFFFDVTYWQSGVSSAGWSCFGSRRGKGWEISDCILAWSKQ